MPRTRHHTLSPTAAAFRDAIHQHIKYSLGKTHESCTQRELYLAVVLALRNRLIDSRLETEANYRKADAKRLYYLSMEYLIGRSLNTNLQNLSMHDDCHDVLQDMGVDLHDVLESEEEAALGNGGLGRLAACFLDSLATLGMPGYGYGINYEYGLFKQTIEGGYQKEQPERWLFHGSPWLIKRPDETCQIPLYGRLIWDHEPDAHRKPRWVDCQEVIAVPHDLPIVGYGGHTVNVLRLFSARSPHEIDLEVFNQGDYLMAMERKIAFEMISKVLYPPDSVEAGRELRLIQEYFLVACAIEDMMRTYLASHDNFDAFPDKVAIQLNDTHPALAVAELMRRLLDDYDLSWSTAWDITQATLAYTNHTLLPEALEKWPVALMEYVLPYHLWLIYEINQRFLRQIRAIWPGDVERLRRMSIIEEGEGKQIRMAHLAIVGSHAINGVSELHSRLLQTSLVPDFYALWPERFSNKTNGITQRRWLLQANPGLARLITATVGDNWITDLETLRELEPCADDRAFQQDFMHIKRANKERLIKVIKASTGISVSPDSLFDVHIKRIHEYKRQTLNVLHIIYLYLSVVESQASLRVPRTFIFAGKAAPGYWAAKQIIKLIHNVADVINNDPRVQDWLKIAFIPDYRVSLAELIVPAADLSEQISTAGMEASGTSNMKFALNGALTIGTHDGANIEIEAEVGTENMYLFGLQPAEVQQMRSRGVYHPQDYFDRNPMLARVMETLRSGMFSLQKPDLFTWLYDAILVQGDYYCHLADFESYMEAQKQAADDYTRAPRWAAKAIRNVARIGKFSSDRTIREYARDIWHIERVYS